MHLQSGHSLGLVLTLEVAMAELASVLLYRGAAPSIQITVLINRGKVVLTCIYLNRLYACKGWNQLGLVVMSPCHLHDSLVLEQAKRGVIVARHHAHTIVAERILKLEA